MGPVIASKRNTRSCRLTSLFRVKEDRPAPINKTAHVARLLATVFSNQTHYRPEWKAFDIEMSDHGDATYRFDNEVLRRFDELV
jgi:hypothetical protein